MSIKLKTTRQASAFMIWIFIIFNGCSGNKSNVETADKSPASEVRLNNEQYKNAGIQTGMVEHINLSSVFRANGWIDVPPQNTVSVSVPMGGRLQSSKLLPGMHIVKGQLIAILEDQQYIQIQEDYLTAITNFAYVESEYLRQKELNASKSSSDKVYEKAKMDYQAQKIKISALAEKLRLLGIDPVRLNETNVSRFIRIYSPINGFVRKVHVNVGQYLGPSDNLFELIDPADIHLKMVIFEKDIHNVYIGQKVMAYTNTKPENKYECTVILISRDLSDQHFAEVHCHFDNYDGNLLPGMYMNTELKLKSNHVPVLPESAIVRFEGKNFIFVESGEKQYQLELVTIGIKSGENVEIQNPSRFENKKIVTNGAYSLLMMLRNH